MTRILYFFPLNPAEKNSGSSNRALGLLLYFKSRGFQVDFVSKKDWGRWTPESIKKFNAAQIADRLFIFRRKPEKKNPVHYFFTYKLHHIRFNKTMSLIKGSIPNHTTLYLRRQFDQLLQENKYDYIIISYAYWADLIRNNTLIRSSVTIIDTHDLLAIQHQQDKDFMLPAAKEDELRRVGMFDQIWAIAPEEAEYFSSQFGNRVKYVPPFIADAVKSSVQVKKDYDLIYVATDNPHNLRSSKWFFEHVFPQLPEGITICIIGTIVDHIPKTLQGVTTIHFADDLNDFYERSRIAVCPMLSGTGVKIKVLEALSHGLPVVCTEKGMDGLPEKNDNGCLPTENANTFAEYINSLLTDTVRYDRQSLLASDFFKKYFSKEQVFLKMDELFHIDPLVSPSG